MILAQNTQKVIDEHICDISGTLNISDNVIVFRKTQVIISNNFSKILWGWSKNKQEQLWNLTGTLLYFGFVSLVTEISPGPKTVEIIYKANPPTIIDRVRSLLGLITNHANLNFSEVY